MFYIRNSERSRLQAEELRRKLLFGMSRLYILCHPLPRLEHRVPQLHRTYAVAGKLHRHLQLPWPVWRLGDGRILAGRLQSLEYGDTWILQEAYALVPCIFDPRLTILSLKADTTG